MHLVLKAALPGRYCGLVRSSAPARMHSGELRHAGARTQQAALRPHCSGPPETLVKHRNASRCIPRVSHVALELPMTSERFIRLICWSNALLDARSLAACSAAGRAQASAVEPGAFKLVLYSKPDCCLCNGLKVPSCPTHGAPSRLAGTAESKISATLYITMPPQ